MRFIARYSHQDLNGNHLLLNVGGDACRSHAYINGRYNRLPAIPRGALIQFWASPLHVDGDMKLTNVRGLVML